ncbi:MAG: Ig-like domain-containing protein, partial [Bacteroidia bacterium]
MKKYILLVIFLFIMIVSFAQHNWLQGAGGNANDEALDVTHDNAGNIYSTGYFSQSARFDNIIIPSAGMSDVFVSKQDSLGTFLWAVRAGGIFDEKATAITVNNLGEIFITGVFTGTAQFGSVTLTSIAGSQDIFIAKLDNSGNFIWAQSYGGSDIDLSSDISVDLAGNITTVGEFKGTSSFGSFTYTSVNYPATMPMSGGLPSYDAIIFKTNSLGNVIWAKRGAAIYDDRVLKVAVDNQANIYVCGQFSDTLSFTGTYNNNAFNAGFLMKIDSAGNELWFKRLIATQFMMYDLKFNKGNLLLTGDFQGVLDYIGTPSHYINNTYPYKVFALKVHATTGDFIAGTSEGSDNMLSSRAIAVDDNENVFTTGYFNCALTSFSIIHGNGIFNSVGFRDVYVVKYDSLLTRTWEKQYGGIGDDYPTAMSIFFNDQPVFAGSYTKNFNTPDGFNFVTHINNLSTNNTNFGLVICGNSFCGSFMTQKGWGNKDILIARPVNSVAPLYDYFKRISGTCSLDTLMPARYPATDTVSDCDKVVVGINTPTTKDSLQAPDWTYSWSNGSTHDTAVFLTSGWKYITYGYADNCRTFTDSFYVQVYHTPPKPIVTVYGALMMEAIPVGLCLNKAVMMSGGTATFVASNIPAGYSFHWTLPGGGTSTSDTIYATTPGVYSVISSSPGGLCNNYNCVELQVWGSGGSIGTLSAFTPEIIFTNTVFNSTDTVRVCKDGHFEMQLVDSTLFSSGLLTGLNTFVSWTITGGYGFDPYASFPTTFGTHKENFIAISSGNCIATATILDPVTGVPIVSVSRNFYLDVHQAPSNIPVISGAAFFCPGDTVTLSASGGGNYIWSGPGIEHLNPPTNDSARVILLGTYDLSSTTIDSVLGCSDNKVIHFDLGSTPAPLVTMSPIHGTICPFDSVHLTAEPGSSYTWYGPTGIVLATTQSIWVSTPGIYYYTFISATGCALASEMVEVKEYSTPYLDALPGTSLCASGNVIISVQSNESSLVNWAAPFSGSAFSQTVTSPGLYSVSVNFCGITTVADITITSGAGTPVDILYWGNDTICAQDTVVLMGSNGYSDYTWYPSMDLGQSYVTTGPGTYFLQAVNQNGCLSSDSIIIYSRPAVAPPTASDTTVCSGSSLTLNASGTGIISWYNDLYAGALIATGNSLPITMGQNDSTFYISSSNGTCASQSVPINVSIYNGSQKPIIVGNKHICAGDSLNLEVYDPVSGVTYTWNGPGLTPFDSTHLSIYPATAASSGVYWVTASNGFCTPQTDSITILVNDPHLHPFSSSTYSVCQYDSLALLTDTLIGSYMWNNGNTSASNLVFAAGPYYYTYTDALGCIAHSDTTNLIVLSAPVINPISDTSVCATSPITFTATNDSSLTVNWYDAAHNLLGTGFSYSISSVMTATTIIVGATDTNGCTNLGDTIHINIVPPIPSPITSLNDSLCIGDTLNLFATNLSGYTYSWTGPGGFTSSSVSPVISPVTMGNAGTYSLVVTNGYCSSDTGNVNIEIMTLPTLTASPDVTICEGATTNLSATSSIGTLTWSTGEITSTISVAPPATTTYTVQTSNMCGTVSDNVTVTIHSHPYVSAGADITLLSGESGQLNGSGAGTYLWTPSNDLSCSNCSNPTFTINQSQNYILTITDSNGCTNSDNVFVS